jgi:hypothetical protein
MSLEGSIIPVVEDMFLERRSNYPVAPGIDRPMTAILHFSDEEVRTRTRSVTLTDPNRAIFGCTYAAEPDELIEQLKGDEAIAEADTLLLTVPNQLGVDYNVHALESILTAVGPLSVGAEGNFE